MVPHGGKWAVRGEQNSRVTSIHDAQAEAIEAGRAIARNQTSELFIHVRHGQIRDRDSYGNDPCPPRDSKH